MKLLDLLLEAAIQSARIMILVMLIVVPLVTVFEIMLRKKILDKVSQRCSNVMGWLDLPGEAALPLVSGLIMGLAYSAGVLYRYEQKKILKTREFNVVCTVLSLWHAIIEDTAIFTALGASFLWIFGFRIIFTVTVVKALLIIGRVIPKLDFFEKE